jgi:hypothetical protein
VEQYQVVAWVGVGEFVGVGVGDSEQDGAAGIEVIEQEILVALILVKRFV